MTAGRGVVVGAAVVRDGCLLAAQRSYPPALAGRWELPGGGVEPGESEADALVRECREELALAVTVRGRLGPDVVLGPDRVLRVHVCDAVGEPTALEHRALAWVAPGELDALDWLDTDRALLPDLRAVLVTRPRGLRRRGPS